MFLEGALFSLGGWQGRPHSRLSPPLPFPLCPSPSPHSSSASFAPPLRGPRRQSPPAKELERGGEGDDRPNGQKGHRARHLGERRPFVHDGAQRVIEQGERQRPERRLHAIG